MESKAVARYIRISPRKARLVVDAIRGKNLEAAQQTLDFSDRAAAKVISKVLRSAAANAENNNSSSPETLFVSRAYVDEGPTLKRFRPRAMGRATSINKRTCHITVILDEREPQKATPRRGKRRAAVTGKIKAAMGKDAHGKQAEVDQDAKPSRAGKSVDVDLKESAVEIESANAIETDVKEKGLPVEEKSED
ncbi:MAG: 50S ribosomal protein L22 [Candidatus Anoxymicrobium japonicum]|uniref:Large ribosomal subunit protein uL22 n=1 Tax=Candidatus Anoxymicrobium japonicum TaxID=2013648 RepID=A0A2N3G5W7_9ACTN|nr:MAG: 50S ribosomal protein L22 [Candidatus Anoxymicrobium japonicum]